MMPMAPTYYELHREEIIKKNRERRLRKMASRPPEDELRKEINKLQSKVNRLEEQVEYYKNLAAKYLKQRMDANAKVKLLKANQRTLTPFKKQIAEEQIEKLEKLIQSDGSSKRLNTLRREKIEELKRSLSK